MTKPTSLGELRQTEWAARARRTVHDELRENLIHRLESGAPVFPGIVGYDDTVVPQIVNAILSRHHFILLGLRGQAKTRILRALTTLLDPWLPIVPGSEIKHGAGARRLVGVAFGGALALAALSFMTAVGWAGATF